MNIELLIKTRDLIARAPAEKFNMSWVSNRCTTSYCFAGWVQLAAGAQGTEIAYAHHSAKLLGIGDQEADRLFFQWPNDHTSFHGNREIWKQWALARLDEIIETGKIEPYIYSKNPFIRGEIYQ